MVLNRFAGVTVMLFEARHCSVSHLFYLKFEISNAAELIQSLDHSGTRKYVLLTGRRIISRYFYLQVRTVIKVSRLLKDLC